MNQLRYLGEKCKRCGRTERFKANRGCVACQYERRGKNRHEKIGAAAARVAAWQKANPERYAAIKAASVKRNPHTHRAQFHRRRIAIIKAGGSYTADEITKLFVTQSYLCTYCPADLTVVPVHHDHKTPIIRGGKNDISNIQLLCETCNLRKGAMTHEEFFAKLKGLG